MCFTLRENDKGSSAVHRNLTKGPVWEYSLQLYEVTTLFKVIEKKNTGYGNAEEIIKHLDHRAQICSSLQSINKKVIYTSSSEECLIYPLFPSKHDHHVTC